MKLDEWLLAIIAEDDTEVMMQWRELPSLQIKVGKERTVIAVLVSGGEVKACHAMSCHACQVRQGHARRGMATNEAHPTPRGMTLILTALRANPAGSEEEGGLQ